MMKIKNLFWVFAIAFGLVLNLSSCKDSDNVSGGDNPGGVETGKDSATGEALLRVLHETAGIDSLPDNWYKPNFTVEPTLGIVNDSNNPYVRYVIVSDAEEATQLYSYMVSDVHSPEFNQKSWSMEGIGSMNFTVQNASDVIATVDVNVQQLPHLTQIRYVPASALGDNGYNSKWGKPYYQFGDVVSVEEDGQTNYWICVRPASKLFNKGQSHWMSFNLNEATSPTEAYRNYKVLSKSKHYDYVLPYQLGYDEASIQSLAQLLYVLDDPQKYKQAAFKNGIGEIKKSELTESLVEQLSENWEDENLWDKVFKTAGKGAISRSELRKSFTKHELNFLYKGYTDHTMFGAPTDPGLYVYTLTGSTFEKGKSNTIRWTRDSKGFDAHSYALTGLKNNGTNDTEHTTALPDTAYVIRYRTGAQMVDPSASSRKDDPAPDKQFTSTKLTIKDVYRYQASLMSTVGYCAVGDKWIPNNSQYEYYCLQNSSEKSNYSTFVRSRYNIDKQDYEGPETADKRKELAFQVLQAYIADYIDKYENSSDPKNKKQAQAISALVKYPTPYNNALKALYRGLEKLTFKHEFGFKSGFDSDYNPYATIYTYSPKYKLIYQTTVTMYIKLGMYVCADGPRQDDDIETTNFLVVMDVIDLDPTGDAIKINGSYERSLMGKERTQAKQQSPNYFYSSKFSK